MNHADEKIHRHRADGRTVLVNARVGAALVGAVQMHEAHVVRHAHAHFLQPFEDNFLVGDHGVRLLRGEPFAETLEIPLRVIRHEERHGMIEVALLDEEARNPLAVHALVQARGQREAEAPVAERAQFAHR